MNKRRLQEIEREFVKSMPRTWPEGYRDIVVELLAEVRRLEGLLPTLKPDCANGCILKQARKIVE